MKNRVLMAVLAFNVVFLIFYTLIGTGWPIALLVALVFAGLGFGAGGLMA